MNTNPKVSVIVPIYNVEKYLHTCVDSLLKQTLKEIEIILVDDGSPDNCPALCDEYAEKDCRIKVIHKENAGLGYARNSGLELACGEYIAFVDSDDYVEPNLYEHTYKLATTFNLDFVRFSYNRFTEEGVFSHVVEDMKPRLFAERDEIREVALNLFTKGINATNTYNLGGSACSMLVHRKFFFDFGLRFPNERQMVSEDFYFSYQMLQRTQRFAKIPTTFYHYRYNPNSLSTTPNLTFIETTVSFCKLLEKMFIADGYAADSRFHAMSYAMEVLRSKIKNIFMSDISKDEMRQWVKDKSNNYYYQRIAKEYPLETLPFKHRVGLKLFIKGRFWLLYNLVVGQEKVRSVISYFLKLKLKS